MQCEETSGVAKAVILFVIFLCGVGLGTALSCDCNTGWNPFSYYAMLSSVMSSPWSSEEIWGAAREQKTLALWSLGAVCTGAISCYVGGPQCAFKTVQGVYTLYMGLKQGGRGGVTRMAPAGQYHMPYHQQNFWAGSMDGSEGFMVLEPPPSNAVQIKALLSEGLRKLHYRKSSCTEQRMQPIEID